MHTFDFLLYSLFLDTPTNESADNGKVEMGMVEKENVKMIRNGCDRKLREAIFYLLQTYIKYKNKNKKM